MKRDEIWILPILIVVMIAPPVRADFYSRRDKVHRFSYKEDDSFGVAKPDQPAKNPSRNSYPDRIIPAQESPSTTQNQSDSGSRAETPRPKYRDVFEQASNKQRGYGDEESAKLALNVGFGFQNFAGGIDFYLPFNRLIGTRLSLEYINTHTPTTVDTQKNSEFDLELAIPNVTPLTPFIAAGPGFYDWRRSDLVEGHENVFDAGRGPTFNGSIGARIRLARYIALVGALKSINYLNVRPKRFDSSHTNFEPHRSQVFKLGFSFIFQ